jgi:hypothetical protein
MTTVKKTNYTEAQEKRLAAVYKPTASEVDRASQMVALSNEMGRTIPSIRSKLSNMKLYVAKVQAAAKGKRVSKAEIVTTISEVENLKNDSFFNSLDSVNRDVLLWIASLQLKAFDLEAELFDTDEAIVAKAAQDALDAAKAESETGDAS